MIANERGAVLIPNLPTFYHAACHFDIFLTSHEYQNISHRHGQVDLQDLLDCAVDIILAWGPTVERLDGERSTRDSVIWCLTEEFGELEVFGSAVEPRRRDELRLPF